MFSLISVEIFKSKPNWFKIKILCLEKHSLQDQGLAWSLWFLNGEQELSLIRIDTAILAVIFMQDQWFRKNSKWILHPNQQ